MFICVHNHKHNEDKISKMMSDNSVVLNSRDKTNFVRNVLVYEFHGLRTNRIQKKLTCLSVFFTEPFVFLQF